MHFVRLKSDTDNVYREAMKLYAISFPTHEQRDISSQATIMGNDDYHFNLIYDEEIMVGILLYWEIGHSIYIEHFCIYPEMRNKKYGKAVLNLLKDMHKTILLEIDPPVDDISMHRKGFYERSGYQINGFDHIHPPYSKKDTGHTLIVMSYPEKISQTDYNIFNEYLKNVVMNF